MIIMDNVCKTYKISKRSAGFVEACKSLFRRNYEEIHALDAVSKLAQKKVVVQGG